MSLGCGISSLNQSHLSQSTCPNESTALSRSEPRESYHTGLVLLSVRNAGVLFSNEQMPIKED